MTINIKDKNCPLKNYDNVDTKTIVKMNSLVNLIKNIKA
jgi:hypothetical protein